MSSITLDAREWFRGASSSDDTNDGGFSPLSKGINFFASIGLMSSGMTVNNKTPLQDTFYGICAWATENNTLGFALGRNSLYPIMFDGSVAGLVPFYTLTYEYIPGISDMIYYKGAFFLSRESDIAMTSDEGVTIDESWWTNTVQPVFTNFSAYHLFLEYGNILYIADGQFLHSWDGTTSLSEVLTLPSGFSITAMTEYNNKILIAAQNGSGAATLFGWDGYSLSFSFRKRLEETVSDMFVFNGTLFFSAGEALGYYTGSSIALLHSTMPFKKYQRTIVRNRLFISGQGNSLTDVICFANPLISKPSFYSIPMTSTLKIGAIYSLDRLSLVFGSYDQVSAGYLGNFNIYGSEIGHSYYSNKMFLGTNSKVRKIIIESAQIVTGDSVAVSYIDDTGTENSLSEPNYSYAVFGAISKHEFIVSTPAATMTCQIKLTFSAGNVKIRRITIIFEPSELKANR